MLKIFVVLVLITGFFVGQSVFATENEIYLFDSKNENLANEVTFSLLPKTKYILDDETSILVKGLHRIGSTEKVPFHHGAYDEGLPYVTIGDDYLEIVTHVETISTQYKYSITINDCKLSGRGLEDMSWRAIDSCEITVQRESSVDVRNSEPLYNFDKRLDTKSRNNAGIFEVNTIGNNFVKLRFLNQYLGNTDRDPYFNFVKSFNADFDIITNYGVKNINVGNLWEESSVVIGPYKINYTILDIGNVNVRCKASCRDIFDIKMQVEIISDPKDHAMKIVEYNSAITQKPASVGYSNLVNKPEFINTKDIPHYMNNPHYRFTDVGVRGNYQYGIKVPPNETLEKTLHCEQDEYAVGASTFIQTGNIVFDKEAQLILHDPENLRGTTWKGKTSLQVFARNLGDTLGTFFASVECHKISSVSFSQQIKLGLSEDQLSCWDNFLLVENTAKNRFACIKPEHVSILSERGWGEIVSPKSDDDIKKLYMSNKPTIYAQGKLSYDENAKWFGSHYRLIPEEIFGISWNEISENEFIIHHEGITEDLIDKKIRVKAIFIPDYTDHDYLFNSCYKCDEPKPGLIIKKVDLIN